MSEHPTSEDRSFAHTPEAATVQAPPNTLFGIIRRLGPGLIIAGSIVGSGELIATTDVGAKAGFILLWLIIIGCVIKVFTQVEFGRYSIVVGKTTMEGLNEVPGPRFKVNWILWYWLVMFLISLGQLGGIVGGVGQALAISWPITSQGAIVNDYDDVDTGIQVTAGLARRFEALLPTLNDADKRAQVQERLTQLHAQEAELTTKLTQMQADLHLQTDDQGHIIPPDSRDDVIWATVITVVTAVILVVGRYGLIQSVSTILVAAFTFITIGNLVHLQTLPDWRVSLQDLLHGLTFELPPAPAKGSMGGLATALAAFGIIGVGATELIQYPYWCLEKGYARWTGPPDDSPQWAARARGWVRVLYWDAWLCMVVYTFATVAFYLLGAAVLGRASLSAEGSQMVRTLAEMYVPVFGSWAHGIFLFGAFAVLYSTFFVANASHARVCADGMRVFGLSSGSSKAVRFWTMLFSALFPVTCLVVYVFVRQPKQLVLISGLMQAIMLPMLGVAALWFRFKRCDVRLRPGRLWDLCLWISFVGLLIAGGWAAWDRISGLFVAG